jgi:hypothetical protein
MHCAAAKPALLAFCCASARASWSAADVVGAMPMPVNVPVAADAGPATAPTSSDVAANTTAARLKMFLIVKILRSLETG